MNRQAASPRNTFFSGRNKCFEFLAITKSTVLSLRNVTRQSTNWGYHLSPFSGANAVVKTSASSLHKVPNILSIKTGSSLVCYKSSLTGFLTCLPKMEIRPWPPSLTDPAGFCSFVGGWCRVLRDWRLSKSQKLILCKTSPMGPVSDVHRKAVSTFSHNNAWLFAYLVGPQGLASNFSPVSFPAWDCSAVCMSDSGSVTCCWTMFACMAPLITRVWLWRVFLRAMHPISSDSTVTYL